MISRLNMEFGLIWEELKKLIVMRRLEEIDNGLSPQYGIPFKMERLEEIDHDLSPQYEIWFKMGSLEEIDNDEKTWSQYGIPFKMGRFEELIIISQIL